MSRLLTAPSLIALGFVALPAVAQQSPPIAIRNVTVIAMNGTAPAANRTVVVREGRITSIGAADSVAIPPGARVVEGRGRYVIPGLWDMHVHTSREGRARYFWPLFLAHGVTGVREMGSYLDTLLYWRAELRRDPHAGPRVVWSSPMFDGAPPSWRHGLAIESPAHARRMVDSMRALGFDFIKVYERLPRDVYLAIAGHARRIGMPVAGHVPRDVDLLTAVRAGQRSIEHGSGIGRACRGGPDSPPCVGAVAALADRGTWVVPTLVVIRGGSVADTALLHDGRLSLVPPELAQRWLADAREALATPSAEDRASDVAGYRRFGRMTGELHQRGVRLLAGTDASDEAFVYAGSSLHDELELLVHAGLSPLDALSAATSRPAEYLGASDSLGTVEVGKLADLVILDADPLADIRNTRRIHAVVTKGRLLARADIAGLLDTARREAARAKPSPPARQ